MIKNYSMRINQLEALLMKNQIRLKKNEDNDKNYLPYEGETNYKQFDNKPLVMLSSEEKINELRGIISEEENKSNFYNVMLKKLMNKLQRIYIIK